MVFLFDRFRHPRSIEALWPANLSLFVEIPFVDRKSFNDALLPQYPL